MSNEPRQYTFVLNGRALGDITHYLGLPAHEAWQAVSSVNEDGGRGFPTRYEAENWLKVRAAMVDGSPPPNAATVEMADGRFFWSEDGWATVHLWNPKTGSNRKLAGKAADQARALWVSKL